MSYLTFCKVFKDGRKDLAPLEPLLFSNAELTASVILADLYKA